MYVDERKNKNGSTTFRISFAGEGGKRTRLSPAKHPKFLTKAEALAWVRTQGAYLAAQRARMAKKLEWRDKYYDFVKLEVEFIAWYKKRAPNSWKSTSLYLVFMFEFFLNQKHAGNVNQWNLLHQEFRDWLEESARGTKLKTAKKLSYSTINHCIRTLNNFQTFLVAYKHMDHEARVVCECFPQHLIGKRSWEDVITKDEFALVHSRLAMRDPDVADFFYVAYWTGMRFSEIRGLPMSYLYGGQLEGPIADELKKHGLNHYGYIVLESQLEGKAVVRTAGSVSRKPLKTKKKISPENARTIPILDKECWNILARRYKTQKVQLVTLVYGHNKDNYLLFDELPMSRLNKGLVEVYRHLGLKPKSFHCCRHSRATYLVGETRSFFLGKAMLGHKSDVHEDYIHIYALINLKAKQKSQNIEEIA